MLCLRRLPYNLYSNLEWEEGTKNLLSILPVFGSQRTSYLFYQFLDPKEPLIYFTSSWIPKNLVYFSSFWIPTSAMGWPIVSCCAGFSFTLSDHDVGSVGNGDNHQCFDCEEHLRHVLTESSIGEVPITRHHYQLRYSYLTQRGYYPHSHDKENEDSFCISTHLQGNPDLHFFGVFDGHGEFGSHCSRFVKDGLVQNLSNDPTLLDDPIKACTSAFLATNKELHESDIDDRDSGTTAITVLVSGDSRAVMGVKGMNNAVLARDLSTDQKPFRRDEYERVKQCGAVVLTTNQLRGEEDPEIQSWGSEETFEGSPPRLWLQNGWVAFTRSLGDSIAESIGVVAEPEVLKLQLNEDHLFLVIASDGVFDFLSSQDVVNTVAKYKDPRKACAAIAATSYKLWLQHAVRTDDITIIIVNINKGQP